MPNKMLHIQISAYQYDEMADKAKQEGQTISAFVRDLIGHHLLGVKRDAQTVPIEQRAVRMDKLAAWLKDAHLSPDDAGGESGVPFVNMTDKAARGEMVYLPRPKAIKLLKYTGLPVSALFEG